jgi:hypothetical protein
LQRIASRQFEGAEGERQTTGSSALFRADAFEAAGGFRGDIVADETADLCIRLRRRGAHVWRSEEPMILVEPTAASFADWRRKAQQDGFDYAAGAALHGGPPERFRATEQARAVMWGGFIPLLVLAGAAIAAAAAGIFSFGGNALAAGVSVLAVGILLYALKIAGAALAAGAMKGDSWTAAGAATLAHFYECRGVARYWFGDRKGARARKAAA